VRWIVDGMNLIGSRPDGWWRDRPGARRRLVGELGRFQRRADEPVEVVFDGKSQAAEVSDGEALGVVVAFAPGGPNAADRAIAALVTGTPDPEGITVVTSDAALADEVRAAGVTVLGVGAFRRLLDEP
jgi:predicted RNA-binding protein with PIN domain